MAEKLSRPKPLVFATFLMCGFNLAAFAMNDPSRQSYATFLVFAVPIVLVSFTVLWFFWQGRNWARRLVLATSVLALLNLLTLPKLAPLVAGIVVSEGALAVWLLVWLNTRTARHFFGMDTR